MSNLFGVPDPGDWDDIVTVLRRHSGPRRADLAGEADAEMRARPTVLTLRPPERGLRSRLLARRASGQS